MTLLTDLDKAVPACRTAIGTTWLDRLPDDAQKEMLAAREKFRSGGYRGVSQTSFARLLIKFATDRGWTVCKVSRMKEWLASLD